LAQGEGQEQGERLQKEVLTSREKVDRLEREREREREREMKQTPRVSTEKEKVTYKSSQVI
jgi:hypothetical protein